MKSKKRRLASLALAAGLLAAYMVITYTPSPAPSSPHRVRSTSSPKASVESKKARGDYFFQMLRDPATNAIPPDIRRRELAYARTLPRKDILTKTTGLANTDEFTWREVGPTDVGGRTRALAVDRTDTTVIIAGGVSGGIWKSTNSGQTWTLKTAMNLPLSVSYVAQDPRVGQTSTWYYTTGEFQGSGQDFSGQANFFGAGIYKSTDNGETWLFLSSTLDTNPIAFNSPFDFISKIVIEPDSGFVFIASNGFGIYRSKDGGASFQLLMGGGGQHRWADIAVASNGTRLATLSEADAGNSTQTDDPGVYRSTNNGDTWTDITPTSFPATHDRSVIAIAPSNPDVGYIMTYTNTSQSNREVVKFFKVTSIAGGTFSDRSANIPDFEGQVGYMDTQGSYNMVISVKPNDENFVLFGGTNLYRTTDGLATVDNTSIGKNKFWVGGYATNNDISQYVNHHADQHALFFDPKNPNILWSGHDGGISRTTSVTAEPMAWEDKNQGYNVTQFYTVAISATAGNTSVVGGTQDNGSPLFDWQNPQNGSDDITTGDGAFAYFGQQFIYSSSQNGEVLRTNLNGDFQAEIKPDGTSGQLFIHPFAVDPSNENVMYYPVGNVMWRNSLIDIAPNGSVGWIQLSNIKSATGTNITALAVSTAAPSNRLYFGASNALDGVKPSIFRLDSANTVTDGSVDISIPDALANLAGPNGLNGAYIHNIAVNPRNGNEILVVLSNYNIVGLYHSTDAGANYTAVEGNLEGANGAGPSLRWAAILPVGSVKTYVVATSVGVFSAATLDGSNTVWTQEGADVLGNTIVSALSARTSDNTVAAATHGRGIFIGTSTVNVQTVTSDTGTVAFTAPDGSQATVKFKSGAVNGHTVTYQNHGRTLNGTLPGEPPPSIPLQYFTLDTTIPDTTSFQADVTVTYTQAQLDSAGVTDENTLALFRYNPADSTWTQLATTVNAGANTATATTGAFSPWGLASATPTGIADGRNGGNAPLAFSLDQNAPNPFNPSTTIRYTVPRQGHVRLEIYNVMGQRILTLVDQPQPAGVYSVVWNGWNDQGRQVSSGVYLYRISAGDFQESKRMTLLK